MLTILAFALSARSSSSVATLSRALESGSSKPSCVKMRQKSLRGVGPCVRRSISRVELYESL